MATTKKRKRGPSVTELMRKLHERVEQLELIDERRGPGPINTHAIAHSAGHLAWDKINSILTPRIERIELVLGTHSAILKSDARRDLHNRLELVEKYLGGNFRAASPFPLRQPTAKGAVDIEKIPVRSERCKFYQKKVDEMKVRRDEINRVSGDLGRWRRNRQRIGLETKSLDAAIEVLDKLSNIAWEMNNPEEAMKKGK